MIATIVGRVAMDAGSADSERHESVKTCGPDAPGWRQAPKKLTLLRGDGDNEPSPPGRSRYKP